MQWKEGMEWNSKSRKEWTKKNPRRHTSSADKHLRRMSVGRVLLDDPHALKRMKMEAEYQNVGMTTHKYMQAASKSIAANKLTDPKAVGVLQQLKRKGPGGGEAQLREEAWNDGEAFGRNTNKRSKKYKFSRSRT